MDDIANRTEVVKDRHFDYRTAVFDEKAIMKGRHRQFVGGKWDEMGQAQLDFLREQGLERHHRFLDVGCGSLRAGRVIAEYLDPAHYYGIDINHALLKAGYEHELTDTTRQRLPGTNLHATDRFDADFGVLFDMAIAQSVFTHVSLNHMRLCLYRLAKVMRPGGRFYATFFQQRKNFPLDGIVERHNPHYTERNIYWYYRKDLRWAADASQWTFRYIGQWGHPGGQRMVEYTRLPD